MHEQIPEAEESAGPASSSESLSEPGYWRAEVSAGMAEMRGRLSALELEQLQLRTDYLQVQRHLLRLERGSDPAWSEVEDPDVQVMNEQINMLRDRIESHAAP